jgi:hypothetical protein
MVQQSPIRVSYEATNGTRETTTAAELSLGGVFVETNLKSPKVGSLVALEIESGSTKVAIDGRVLAHKPNGFSVGFIDLPNDVASSLHFILSTKIKRRGTTLGLGEAEEGVSKYISEPRLGVADPSSGAPVDPAPASSRPAPAKAAPVQSAAPGERVTDAYAPRHPTPRIMPAAPISRPPGPAGEAYGVPPAATSSAPAVMLPTAPSSRPQRSPPSSAFPAAPKGGKAAIVIAVVVVLLVGIAVTIILRR